MPKLTNFTDLTKLKSYRWPKKGDLPFRKAARPKAAGPLTDDGISRAVFIMNGFMLGGEALANKVLRATSERYELVYPMVYCYRHAVETGLKWLIAAYGPQMGVKPKNFNDTHDLWSLWSDCLRIFKECGAKTDDEQMRAVQRSSSSSRLGQRGDDFPLCGKAKRQSLKIPAFKHRREQPEDRDERYCSLL